MCRFAAYLGHPLKLCQLVTEPSHSLIHQSYQAKERPEPLNGDGFGVAWFPPDAGSRPALFKDTSPAWNNDNLREIARVTQSHCILAHVRAASPGSAVQRLNCHPFCMGHLALMHNGFLAGFPRWRRSLLAQLSDLAFENIRGSTDSEHAFALLYDHYLRLNPQMPPLERLLQSVSATIDNLETLKFQAGVEEHSHFNFAIADGEHIVATRYCSCPADLPAASLHYTTGSRFHCQDGRMAMEASAEIADVVLIASEEMTPDFCWEEVPVNSAVLASHPGRIEIRSLSQGCRQR